MWKILLILSTLLLIHANAATQSDYAALTNEIKEKGGMVDAVKIITREDGQRALVATKTIPKGTIAVSMPPSMSLCPGNLPETKMAESFAGTPEKWNEMVKGLNDASSLAILLLLEASRQAESPWSNYIATLPTEAALGAYGVTMKKDDLKHLDGAVSAEYMSMAFESVDTILTNITDFFSQHDAVVKSFYPNVEASPARVEWALSMVMSRRSPMRREGALTSCLLPLLDMINHRPGTGRIDLEGKMMAKVAMKDIQEGDEIFTSYGDFSIEIGMMNYGFASPEMAVNMGPAFRVLLQKHLDDENPPYGLSHSENVAKQVLSHECSGIDRAANGGVIGWKLLKRLMQCTRILSLDPTGLEILVRREPEEKDISARPFEFNAETTALETLTEVFNNYQIEDDKYLKSEAGRKNLSEMNVGEKFSWALRKAERLFVKGHAKQIKAKYDQLEHLGDLLDEDQAKWEAKWADKKQFRLTDGVDKQKQIEAEEARVQAAIAGSYLGGKPSVPSIHDSGSEYDEF